MVCYSQLIKSEPLCSFLILSVQTHGNIFFFPSLHVLLPRDKWSFSSTLIGNHWVFNDFFPQYLQCHFWLYIASRRKLSLRKFSRKISCSLRKYITFKRIKLINIIYGNILLFWCGWFRECKTAAITKNQFVLFIYCQQLDMNIIQFIKRYLRRCWIWTFPDRFLTKWNVLQ